MEKQLKRKEIKLIKIGNSRGIRIPKKLIQKYGFSDTLIIEETDEGIYVRAKENQKIDWERTYKEMAKEEEEWNDFDATLADGLDNEEY